MVIDEELVLVLSCCFLFLAPHSTIFEQKKNLFEHRIFVILAKKIWVAGNIGAPNLSSDNPLCYELTFNFYEVSD